MIRQTLLTGVVGLLVAVCPVTALGQTKAGRSPRKVDPAARAAILRAQQSQARQRAYSVGVTMKTHELESGAPVSQMETARLVHVLPDRFQQWTTSGFPATEWVKIGGDVWSRTAKGTWEEAMDSPSWWRALRSPPHIDTPGHLVTEARTLPSVVLTGVTAARYRYVVTKGDDVWDVTMWVAPPLNLPIRYRAASKWIGKATWTWEIVYDDALKVDRPVAGAVCSPGSDCLDFGLPTAKPVAAPGANPRDIVVAWLLAPSIDEALKFLIESTAETWRRARAQFAGAGVGHLLRTIDLSFAPGPAVAATGAIGAARGRPAAGVAFFGGRALDVSFDRDEITGDRAIVHLHADVGDEQPVKGKVELIRGETGWRIAGVDMGADIRHSHLDKPNAVSAVAQRVGVPLERSRASGLRAQGIGALRAVQRAQEAFAAINGGFAAPLECLTAPRTCLATLPADSPPLLGDLNVTGFTPTFVAGATPSAAELRASPAANRSLKSWAYVLTPTEASLGPESLCVDSTPRMCTFTGAPSMVRAGTCPASCVTLK